MRYSCMIETCVNSVAKTADARQSRRRDVFSGLAYWLQNGEQRPEAKLLSDVAWHDEIFRMTRPVRYTASELCASVRIWNRRGQSTIRRGSWIGALFHRICVALAVNEQAAAARQWVPASRYNRSSLTIRWPGHL